MMLVTIAAPLYTHLTQWVELNAFVSKNRVLRVEAIWPTYCMGDRV